MRLALVSLTVVLSLPLPAAADCAEDIAALFAGGPYDPFVRPNRREVTVEIAPDGTETQLFEVVWDGPVKAITCTAALCSMQVGNRMWMQPTGQGPWLAAPSQLPDDPEAFARATADAIAAGITETACLDGALEGQPVKLYRYRTQTEPNEFGAWWGGVYTLYLDPAIEQIVRIDETESIASWAPEPSVNTKVMTITYDDTISIEAPD